LSSRHDFLALEIPMQAQESRVGVECLIQSNVCFTHSAVSPLALGFVFFKDHANPLALLGREAQLFDLIFTAGGWRRILRVIEAGHSEEKNWREESD